MRLTAFLWSLAAFVIVAVTAVAATPGSNVQNFIAQRFDGLWPSSAAMNVSYSAITLVQAPSSGSRCNSSVSNFDFHPGNVSSCGADAFPVGIYADDFPGWTDGAPGNWLFGFFATPMRAVQIFDKGCDQRLIWTEGYDQHVCEFRILYSGKGNGTVDCDCNFTTGDSPSCAALGMVCRMGFDRVALADGRSIDVHQATFAC